MEEKDGRGGGRECAQDYYSSLTLRGAVSCGSDVVRAAASYIISYLQVRQGQSGQTRVVEAVASPRVHQLICCPGLLVPSHVVITQNGVCPKPILGSALSPAVGICVNSESSTTCSPTVGGTLIRYEPPQYRHRPRQCHTRSGLWSAEGDGHVISRCHRSSFLSAESSQPTPHHRPDPSKRRNDETTRRRDDVTT